MRDLDYALHCILSARLYVARMPQGGAMFIQYSVGEILQTKMIGNFAGVRWLHLKKKKRLSLANQSRFCFSKTCGLSCSPRWGCLGWTAWGCDRAGPGATKGFGAFKATNLSHRTVTLRLFHTTTPHTSLLDMSQGGVIYAQESTLTFTKCVVDSNEAVNLYYLCHSVPMDRHH